MPGRIGEYLPSRPIKSAGGDSVSPCSRHIDRGPQIAAETAQDNEPHVLDAG